MGGACSTYRERIGAYRVLVERPEEDNIKMGLQEVGWGPLTGLICLWIGTGGGLL
jgi:hypothetical protein